MEDSREKKLFKKFAEAMESLLTSEGDEDIIGDLSNGKTSYLRLDRIESSSFDPSWIDKIEEVIFDLGDIINNPRINTKTVGDIAPVELARKTGAESIRHLASHTQYIKEIDDYGNVIPSKVLSFSNEDELFTYENRFIATFVRKLMLFIEKRYEFVMNFATLHDQEVLYIKNKSFVRGASVEIETKVKVVSDSLSEMGQLNSAYVERIKEIRQYVYYFYNSPFMKAFKTEKNVRNPIIQTNIIRKNPKYRHCYEVYRFIERYETLGVNYRVDEDYSDFNDEELHQLHYALFASYLSLMGKDKPKPLKQNTKVYKPKILTSLDDESFVYGPLLKGPIQFVRVDEGYQKYLETLIHRDLPTRPRKREKHYYSDEYQDRKDLVEFIRQRDSLLRRKEREIRAFEKAAEEIVKLREQERIRLAEMERTIREAEEEDRLNKIRAQIIAAAREQALSFPAEEPEMETPEALEVPEMEHPEDEHGPAMVAENKAAINSEGPDPSTIPMPEPKPQEEAKPQVDSQQKPEEPMPEEKPAQPASEETAEEEQPEQETAEETLEEPKPQEEAEPIEETLAEEPALAEEPNKEQGQEPEQIPEEVAAPVLEEPGEGEEQAAEEQPATQEEATPVSISEEPIQEEVPSEEEPSQEITEEQGQEETAEQSAEEHAEEPKPEEEATPVATLGEGEEAPAQEAPAPVVEEQEPAEEPAPAPIKPVRKKRSLRARPNVKLRRKDEPEKPVSEQPAGPVEQEQKPEEPTPDAIIEGNKPEEPVAEEQPSSLEQPAEEALVEQQQMAEEPVEEPLEQPVEEPLQQEEPTPDAILEEPQEEAPLEQPEEEPAEQPIEEEPAEPVSEEPAREEEPEQEPVEETLEQPVEEPLQQEEATPDAISPETAPEDTPAQEEPTPAPTEEEPAHEEQPQETPAPSYSFTFSSPSGGDEALYSQPEASEPVEEPKPEPAPEPQVERPEPKPGRFIVKTPDGYYAGPKKMSQSKNDAIIFDDFNEAYAIKAKLGGKVVKV